MLSRILLSIDMASCFFLSSFVNLFKCTIFRWSFLHALIHRFKQTLTHSLTHSIEHLYIETDDWIKLTNLKLYSETLLSIHHYIARIIIWNNWNPHSDATHLKIRCTSRFTWMQSVNKSWTVAKHDTNTPEIQ